MPHNYALGLCYVPGGTLKIYWWGFALTHKKGPGGTGTIRRGGGGCQKNWSSKKRGSIGVLGTGPTGPTRRGGGGVLGEGIIHFVFKRRGFHEIAILSQITFVFFFNSSCIISADKFVYIIDMCPLINTNVIQLCLPYMN